MNTTRHDPRPHPRPQGLNNTTGWSVYDAYDEKQHRDASWLARSHDTLPLNYREHEKHRSWIDVDPTSPIAVAIRRLTHFRKIIMRKFDGLLRHRRESLTTSSPSSSSMVPAGDTVRFILLCSLWYMSSALSSNTGKVILNQFRYPITLTFVQFGFVAAYCLLFMSPLIRFTTFRRPTKAILRSTLPMGFFQVGGHIFSSMAISRIPVSTVHTIKALSPLFTVATYALLFGVSYSAKTYFSLLPLTIGVMLACSFDMSASNAIGLLCAFGSAIVFVSSNIFFKKIMPSNSSTTAHKLDKVNLLFYSSSMAFLLMVPIWMYSDLPSLMYHTHMHVDDHHSHPVLSTFTHFLINGTVHFLQNVLAFVLLAQTSPVTYSIASLIKRVAVICIAVIWFRQHVHIIQGLGIGLTFIGLWCYHGAKGDVEKGEKKVRRVENAREGMLPSVRSEVESETEEQEKVRVTVQSTGIPTPIIHSRPRTISHLPHPHNQQHLAPPPSFFPHNSHANAYPQPQHHQVSATTTTYSQTHAHANLNLQVHVPSSTQHTPVESKQEMPTPAAQTSPVDSYPSPPPSDASPPSSPELEGKDASLAAGILGKTETLLEGDRRGRRSTITAHTHGHGAYGPHNRMASMPRVSVAA